jgi:thymidylate synthase
MRSNDAIWGLPYDVFLFTFLQEMMAIELKVELGSYYHFAGSLHLYERHLGLANRILESQSTSLHEIEMPPIDRLEDSLVFLAFEEALRRETTTHEITQLSPYWRELAEVLHVFHASKNFGWIKALEICSPSNRYLPFLAMFAEVRSPVRD